MKTWKLEPKSSPSEKLSLLWMRVSPPNCSELPVPICIVYYVGGELSLKYKRTFTSKKPSIQKNVFIHSFVLQGTQWFRIYISIPPKLQWFIHTAFCWISTITFEARESSYKFLTLTIFSLYFSCNQKLD
jgi:hypothetical protein